MDKSRPILVTGGCGFIGSHLVDRLVEEGRIVRVIDNLSAESNEKFYFNEKAQYYNFDILDAEKVSSLADDCETIYHLAAESRIGPSIQNPARACEINLVGTCNVLQAAREKRVNSVVYSSTSACYGLAEKFPQKETDSINNLNPYSVSKYAAEDLCRMYHRLWGVNTVSLRYFNVFGERMPTKGQYAPVVGIFLKQLSEKSSLTVVGDGLQSRDFVHVSDVVSANLNASISSACYGRVFNVGSGVSYTILDVAKSISSDITHLPPRIGEAKDTLADISALVQSSDWRPKVDLMNWINCRL